MITCRKACSWCRGLTNPSQCESGKFDSGQIGPWTLWQGNLHAEVLVVGQDWGDTPSNPTNKTLRHLMSVAGLRIDAPSAANSGAGIAFFTNAILCLKHGGMQAAVDPVWFANCGKLFLRPTIELIAPNAVVTLGVRAYRAVC